MRRAVRFDFFPKNNGPNRLPRLVGRLSDPAPDPARPGRTVLSRHDRLFAVGSSPASPARAWRRSFTFAAGRGRPPAGSFNLVSNLTNCPPIYRPGARFFSFFPPRRLAVRPRGRGSVPLDKSWKLSGKNGPVLHFFPSFGQSFWRGPEKILEARDNRRLFFPSGAGPNRAAAREERPPGRRVEKDGPALVK